MAAIMQGQRPRRTNDSQRSVPGSASTIQFVYSLTLLILLWLGWRVTARPVTVTVDGLTDTVYTHRHTVALLLTDLGVNLGAREKVTPQLDATLQANAQVTVARARQWRILADSRDFTITSWGETPRTILEDATIAIEPYDEVVIGGEPSIGTHVFECLLCAPKVADAVVEHRDERHEGPAITTSAITASPWWTEPRCPRPERRRGGTWPHP